MIIRPAEQRDALVIQDIWNHAIEKTTQTFTTDLKTRDEIESLIQNSLVFWVAVDEKTDAVLGYAKLDAFRSGPGYKHTAEHGVYVHSKAHGKGIGRALMAQIEASAKNGGIHALVAGVSSENETACRFHEALGFQEVGRMPEVGRKFDKWLDLVLLQKML